MPLNGLYLSHILYSHNSLDYYFHKLPIILCVYLVEVSQGLLFSHEHLGKLGALLWVQPHHVSQQEHVVGSVANLLGIQDDLLVLAGLSKTLDHLHG